MEQLEAERTEQQTDQKDTALEARLVTDSAERPSEAHHGTTARSRDPLVRISFSPEVRDMLGGDLVGVDRDDGFVL